MGCDIHLFVEKLEGGKWRNVPPPPRSCWSCAEEVDKGCHWCGGTGVDKNPAWYDGRNYTLFALLANVRNSDGRVTPIAAHRGIPDDLDVVNKSEMELWGADAHSRSWLSLVELINHDWGELIPHAAYLSAPVYKSFRNGGDPYPCSGSVGGAVKVVSNEEMDVLLDCEGDGIDDVIGGFYTEVKWSETTAHRCQVFYDSVVLKLKQLEEPDKVRIVFFFDN